MQPVKQEGDDWTAEILKIANSYKNTDYVLATTLNALHRVHHLTAMTHWSRDHIISIL